MFPNGNKLSLE